MPAAQRTELKTETTPSKEERPASTRKNPRGNRRQKPVVSHSQIGGHCFSPGQQKPERPDLDGKESAQKSEAGRRDPERGLFFREKPPAKPSDEKRHGQKGRSGHTNDVTNEGRQRSVEAKGGKNWPEKAHFEHHDRK